MHKASLSVTASIISTYKRLSYQPWYALAEFIDNSTQAYFNNQEDLDTIYESENSRLKVDILYDKFNHTLTIKDNSIGMNLNILKHALSIGNPDPILTKGRSKYGLGMKTASCWFGDIWIIKTKRYGHDKAYSCIIDVNKIVDSANTSNVEELDITEEDADGNDHYTQIIITKMHRYLHGNTINKIKDFLTKMYARDIFGNIMQLSFNSDILKPDNIQDKLYIKADKAKYKINFAFSVGSEAKRKVEGWVSVIFPGGSRELSGFTVFMNNRVIVCPPEAYKPDNIFGPSGGTNNLLNQRLVGELNFVNFEVGHQKDAIIWEDDDEEEVARRLREYCLPAMELAETLRKEKEDNNGLLPQDKIKSQLEESVSPMRKVLESAEFSNTMSELMFTSKREEILTEKFKSEVKKIKSISIPFFSAEVDLIDYKLTIKLFASSKSEYEPYLFVDHNDSNLEILGVINVLHPYFTTFSHPNTTRKFLEECVFDAIAEWKCRKFYGELKPNVFREIKDRFLRLPLEFS